VTTFAQRLSLLIRSMEMGFDVKLESGHTLVWVDEHEGPGFLSTVYNPGPEGQYNKVMDNYVMQINSDTAWMMLIDHARKTKPEDANILAANMALTDINRKKR